MPMMSSARKGFRSTGKSCRSHNAATGAGITICRFSGDRIKEAFVNWDALGLMQQLGVVTLPGKAAAAGA